MKLALHAVVSCATDRGRIRRMGLFDWLKGRTVAEPPGLQGWREAWETAVASEPDHEAVQRLRAELDSLGAPEEDIEVEREMLDGLMALHDLAGRVRTSGLPVVETGHRVVGSDTCHFSAPASMPDDPGQPVGRLLLTSHRAIFAGGPGAAVPWHAVPDAQRAARDIILVHRGRDRVHRFRCNSFADALTAAYIARQLAGRRT